MGKPSIYAIDFGTTNSLLAAANADEVFAPIPLDPHNPDPSILRTLLYFPSMKQVYYGLPAISEFSGRDGHGRLIRSIKKQLPVRSFIGTWIEDRPANLEDLIGFFLREMRRRADEYFGTKIDRVVLGRPARFSLVDEDDTFAEFRLREGAKRAGFNEIYFCPEPVAAAFEFQGTMQEPKVVFIGDFGGGTSDFTVIELMPGTGGSAKVLSLGGVALAGDAFDGSIMRSELAPEFGAGVQYRVPFGTNVLTMPVHLMERLCSAADICFLGKRDITEFLTNVGKWATTKEDKRKMSRLMTLIQDQLGFAVFEEIEGSKRRLSEENSTRIALPHPGIELDKTLTRARFEQDSQPVLGPIVETLDRVLKDSGRTARDIDVVCCTGGTARVPALQREIIARFGAEKVLQHRHFHSVVEGLAREAQRKLRA